VRRALESVGWRTHNNSPKRVRALVVRVRMRVHLHVRLRVRVHALRVRVARNRPPVLSVLRGPVLYDWVRVRLGSAPARHTWDPTGCTNGFC